MLAREFRSRGHPLMSEDPVVLEGRFVVQRALALPQWHVTRLLLTPSAHAALESDLLRTPPARQPAVEILSRADMAAITGIRFHQGCLGYAVRPAPAAWPDLNLPIESGSLIVVLEDVRDPDNVGSIFRSALAFGARAVLVGPGCADPLYRKAIRTSMAAALALPFAAALPWPGVLDDLKTRGFAVVATTPDRRAEPIAEVAASLDRRPVALLVGSEGHGLSQAALTASDRMARIPVAGVDSLNVAHATAIALYAITAQSVV